MRTQLATSGTTVRSEDQTFEREAGAWAQEALSLIQTMRCMKRCKEDALVRLRESLRQLLLLVSRISAMETCLDWLHKASLVVSSWNPLLSRRSVLEPVQLGLLSISPSMHLSLGSRGRFTDQTLTLPRIPHAEAVRGRADVAGGGRTQLGCNSSR